MKPLDLEAVKQGKPIVTRDGHKAKFIAYVPEANEGNRVLVLVNGVPWSFYEDGAFTKTCSGHQMDLFMAPEVRRGFINLFVNDQGKAVTSYNVFTTREDALRHMDTVGLGYNYVKTIEVEVEL